MSCYVVAHTLRRAERLLIPSGHVIADAECYVRSVWVDSTPIIFNQPFDYHFNSAITQQRGGGKQS